MLFYSLDEFNDNLYVPFRNVQVKVHPSGLEWYDLAVAFFPWLVITWPQWSQLFWMSWNLFNETHLAWTVELCVLSVILIGLDVLYFMQIWNTSNESLVAKWKQEDGDPDVSYACMALRFTEKKKVTW